MPGFAVMIIVGGAVLIAGLLVKVVSKKSGATLVLRKFSVNEDPSDGTFVEIVGRPAGIGAWLLTILGFDAETTLRVTRDHISFSASSLFGQLNHVVPAGRVSSVHCGYAKPFGLLICAALSLLGGLVLTIASQGIGRLFLGLLLAVVCVVVYALKKHMTFSFETSGGMVLGMSFKRSVIENVPVDLARLELATQLIIDKSAKHE